MKKHVSRNERNYQHKKTIQGQKNNGKEKGKRPSFFILLILKNYCQLTHFIYFFVSWLLIISINAFKLKRLRLKQLDLLTHVLINDIIQVRVLVIMTKKKLRKIECGNVFTHFVGLVLKESKYQTTIVVLD